MWVNGAFPQERHIGSGQVLLPKSYKTFVVFRAFGVWEFQIRIQGLYDYSKNGFITFYGYVQTGKGARFYKLSPGGAGFEPRSSHFQMECSF